MRDRGPEMPNEFPTPCPPWCDGIHAPEVGWGLSQFHATQPLDLDFQLNGETYTVGEIDITQFPAATDPFKREAFISMHLEDPDGEMGPADAEALAAAFELWAGQLRGLAATLARIRADDVAAKAWRT